MEKPLCIPPSKNYTGLTVFCTKCNTNVSETCRTTGNPIQRCPFGDKQRFKIYVHKPGTRNTRVTKIFQTRNLDNAIAEAIQFKKELEEKDFSGVSVPSSVKSNQLKKEIQTVNNETLPLNLLQVQSRYLGFMSGDKEICPSYMYRPRSKQHLADISRGMECLIISLKEAQYPIEQLKITDIDKHALGVFYDYMNTRKLSGCTINKYLGYLTTMYTWLIKQEGYQIQNIFEGVRRHSVKAQEIESITKEEIQKLLKAVKNKKLGIEELSTGEKKSLWKPWLAPAIRLSLFSGRRGAEIFELRFSSIIEEKGEMTFIRSEDIKVNKIRNLQGDAKKYVSIPITSELKKLLLELGYKKNKGTSKYLIADEEKMQRDTMARHLWRAFGHYAKKIKLNKTFKSLRKTHASALAAIMGAENARIITGHSGLKVMEDHYFDKKVIGKVASDFSVFGKNKVS